MDDQTMETDAEEMVGEAVAEEMGGDVEKPLEEEGMGGGEEMGSADDDETATDVVEEMPEEATEEIM